MHVEAADPVPAVPPRRPPTIEDWLAVPEEARAEFIGDRLVYQGRPGPQHGRAQGTTFSFVREPYDRRPGDAAKPGGWWLSQEVDMHIGGIGCRPDLVGWRRDRVPRLPRPDARGVVTEVPDWICEVLSPSTAQVDWGLKRRAYHQAGVPFYWLLDPDRGTLTVLRRVDEDYLLALVAVSDEAVRAPPFEAIELVVRDLFGDDGEEPAKDPAEER